jgi:hypothetical protein
LTPPAAILSCPPLEYEPALQLTLAGADTSVKNNFGQTAIVLTEDATMLRLLSAVSKQTADLDVRGTS